MMRSTRTILMLACLFGASVSLAAGPAIESGAAACSLDQATNTSCNLRWDLSTTPRSTYAVQWLNPETGQWEDAIGQRFVSPYAASGDLPAGRLYRVLGCDEFGRKWNCISTSAHWAPVMPAAEDIPDFVDIRVAGGIAQQSAISKDAHHYTQVMQLNVYLLADVIGRAPLAVLPRMSAPPEPGKPGDMAHDVHHNVYAAYEAARKQRSVRLAPAYLD